MISRAVAVLALAAVACGRGEVGPSRERVLARVPGDVMLVVATDGATLANPRVAGVLDVVRPRWPERLGCVIDAARTARHVALGITRARSAVLVLELPDAPACPALSRIPADGEPALWVATLGSAAPAAARTSSVLDEPRFARALPYLSTAPFAVALEIPGGAAIATARPDPVEAWLALEMAPWFADAAEGHVRGFVERLGREPTTVQLARRLEVTREDAQILVRLDELPGADPSGTDAELAVALRTILSWYGPASAPAATFSCPPLLPPVVRCAGGTRFELRSLAELSPHILASSGAPVIRGGLAAGVRLTTPLPRLGLRAGDVVRGYAGTAIRDLRSLATALETARGQVVVAVERDGEIARIELVGP